MRMKIQFLVAALILFLGSCTIYQDIEVSEVRDIRIIEVTKDGLIAEVDLKIYNPNPYRLTIVNVDADLYLNDKDIGDAQINERITIGKKSSHVYTIKLEGDYTKMGGSLLEGLLGSLFSQTANLRIDGTIKGRALLIGKRVFFQVEQDVKIQ